MAKSAVFSGDSVWATTRSQGKAAELTRLGIQGVLADWTRPETLQSLPPDVDRVLIAVSYDATAGISRLDSQVGGLQNLLPWLPPETRICYISTTGVYQQCDGSWVTEESEANPDRESSRVHLQAEELLLRQRPKTAVILRLAGIYGPGRLPRIADIKAGQPIAGSESGYLNLIHVDDAAAVVRSSWSQSRHPLYLVSDDHPVVRGDFYREIAKRCDVSPPHFVPPAATASDRTRSPSNKRVCNRRMKADLASQLQFPSYMEGLTDALSK